MGSALDQLIQLAKDPYATAAQLKQAKHKLIGWFPMEIPEELIHAAGFDPIPIWLGNEPVTLGHSYVMYYDCAITRSLVDDLLKGKLWFLDGLVLFRQCLQAEELPFILRRHAKIPYQEYLYLPAIYPTRAAREFLLRELNRFRSSLERFSGNPITQAELRSSICLFNQLRALIRQLYDMRRQDPSILKQDELCSIVQACMILPKHRAIQLVQQLISELAGRKALVGNRIRVILAGCMCQRPRSDVLNLIEDLGMIVVDDDLYVGSRYGLYQVDLGADPMAGLVERYFRKIPPSLTKGDWENTWGDYILEMVNHAEAQAVISLMPKFCPPHLCYYPDFKSKLERQGIPEVLIELEHESVSLEGIRIRLQAFAESLRR